MPTKSPVISPRQFWFDSYYLRGLKIELHSSHIPLLSCISHNIDYSKCIANSGADTNWVVLAECFGHRNINSNENTIPTEVEPLTKITASIINDLRDIVEKELKTRKKNGKYDKSNITLNKKVKTGEISLADTINNFAKHLSARDDKGNVYFMLDTYTKAAPTVNAKTKILAKNYNDLVTATIGLMNDCICYADCNGYSVCWCYGNCYNY